MRRTSSEETLEFAKIFSDFEKESVYDKIIFSVDLTHSNLHINKQIS
jgi:hypothetical protein